MIPAFHAIWTAYGWWLPNDPRGSWSEEVWHPEIRDLGERYLGRRPEQPTPDALRDWLASAQGELRHDPTILDGPAALAAARGIRSQREKHGYALLALAVLPDHVHAVFRRHRHRYERVIGGLKAVAGNRVRRHWGTEPDASSRTRLNRRKETRPVWARGYWIRYLNTDTHIASAVRYVQRNPVRMGLPAQRWSFLSV